MKKTVLSAALSMLAFFMPVPARADLVPASPPTNVNAHQVPSAAQWLTGPSSKNSTVLNQYYVLGTDLGIPWSDGQGHVLVAFGDSFNVPGNGGPVIQDWRRGTLAWTPDGSTIDGFLFSTLNGWNGAEMMVAPEPGSPDTGALPTAGFTYGGTDYVHFMAMNVFSSKDGGAWSTYYSGIAQRGTALSGSNAVATASDQEEQFARMSFYDRMEFYDDDYTWGPLSNFAQAAALVWGDYVYLFGTPAGRTGAVKLSRVLASALFDNNSQAAYTNFYEYWDGATWQANEAAGIYIVPAAVAELSVQFDAPLGRFVMTYLDENRGLIVMRDAPSIEGPYGQEKTVLNAPPSTLYGGFINPIAATGSGSLTLNVSSWQDYNVFQYTTPLSNRQQADDLVNDNGFEDDGSFGVGPAWAGSVTVSPAVPVSKFWATVPPTPPQSVHSGSRAAFMNTTTADEGTNAWHDISQILTVTPGASYQFTAWVQSSNVTQAFVGVRQAGAPVPQDGTDSLSGFIEGPTSSAPIQEEPIPPSATYTAVNFVFNAGANNTVAIFAGFYGSGAPGWMDMDDLSITPLDVAPDSGFEQQATSKVGWPFLTEGTAAAGVDIFGVTYTGTNFAYAGLNEAWIFNTSASQWNAITELVSVQPNTIYALTGFTETSSIFGAGYFGVRNPANNADILAQVQYGASPCSNASRSCYGEHELAFDSGSLTQVRVFAGYWSPPTAGETWLRVDNLQVAEVGY
jgi:hypothetical protein